MPVKTESIGKSYPPSEYVIGTEKIREYAAATNNTAPLCNDEQAAKAAGHDGLVAPPMFAVVYSSRALAPAMFDPAVGMNFAAMVHGSEDLTYGVPAIAGDRITTTAKVKDISERDGKGFYLFETESVNQRGENVCTAVWTLIVRGV